MEPPRCNARLQDSHRHLGRGVGAIAGDSDGLVDVEPGTGSDRLGEAVRAQRVADLSPHLGF